MNTALKMLAQSFTRAHGLWLRQGSPKSNFQDKLLSKNGYAQGLGGHTVLILANITLLILVTITTIVAARIYQYLLCTRH